VAPAAPGGISRGGTCLDAEVRINRADFGLTWNPMGLVELNNTLTIHAVITRQ
jgi:hypothetical protein